MKKRLLCIILALVMCASLLPLNALAAEGSLDNFKKVQTYKDGTFTDVKPADWFYRNVVSNYEYMLMLGRSENFFDTESYLTAVECLTLAARLHSTYYTGRADFAPADPWYLPYTEYCSLNGIANPNNYELDKPVTRAQFADIFANALPAEALKKINTVDKDAIPDVKYSDGCGPAIYTLYRAGVLVGNDSKGTYSPKSNIRRCEAGAIVTRMAVPELRQSITLEKDDSAIAVAALTGMKCTVSFDCPQGAPVPEPQKVKKGEKLVKPQDPVAEGFYFDGWFTDITLKNKWDFDNDTVSKSMKLYAGWTECTTVEDVIALADGGFPSDEVYAWRTESGNKLFFAAGSLLYRNEHANSALSDYETLSREDYGYLYSDEWRDVKFNIENGKLTSVEITADDVLSLSGTYLPPETKTFAQILALADSFPTNADDGWVCADNGNTCYLDEYLAFKKEDSAPLSQSTGLIAAKSEEGYHYFHERSGREIVFTVESGKLTGITVTIPLPVGYSGTYKPKKVISTVGDVLDTVGDFPTYDGGIPENAWTNGSAHSYIASVYLMFAGNNNEGVELNASVTQSGDNWTVEAEFSSITFIMSEGKLTSIECSGATSIYEDLNGTYHLPLPPG